MHVDVTLQNFLQLLVDGLINGSAFALLGVSFGLILSVTGRFHFAYAFTYTLAAYIAAEVGLSFHASFPVAIVIGALAAMVLGVLMELVVYRPVAKRAGVYALLTIFVSSLGMAIAGENLMAVIFHTSASYSIAGVAIKGIAIGDIDFTNLNVEAVVVAWVLIVVLAIVLGRSMFGRMVRAVRSNPDMSLAVGVNPRTIFLAVFAIGSLLSGVAGVFAAAQTAATPQMGETPVFYAFTVAFLAGSRPTRDVALVGLGLGLVQSLSSLFFQSQYQELVVFIILFAYVALRPLRLRALFARQSAPGVAAG
ncbi:MAG: branched-chain amino acid ABC transporter permease [Acidimicrobiales bacterium]